MGGKNTDIGYDEAGNQLNSGINKTEEIRTDCA